MPAMNPMQSSYSPGHEIDRDDPRRGRMRYACTAWIIARQINDRLLMSRDFSDDQRSIIKDHPSGQSIVTYTSSPSSCTAYVGTRIPTGGTIALPLRTLYVQPCHGQVTVSSISTPDESGPPWWRQASPKA